MAKVETMALKQFPLTTDVAWKTLCYFSNNQVEEGEKYLASVLTKDEKTPAAWMIGFDFCRLTGKKNVLAQLTERYAGIFHKPPPDWITQPVDQPEQQSSKGTIINILSVSNPESEQYNAAFTAVQEKKTALLLKFGVGRALSWQDIAVQRLSKGIETLRKLNIPIYVEQPDVAMQHIKKIAFDRRTDADWVILFYLLLYTNQEPAFEEEALQYTLVKGMSPPSFEKLKYAPIQNWFDSSGAASADESTGAIVLTGVLSNHIGGLASRITQRLQKQESVTLDLRGISHADWTSIFEITNLHNKIWETGSRKLFITRPTALINKMFEYADIQDKSFVMTK